MRASSIRAGIAIAAIANATVAVRSFALILSQVSEDMDETPPNDKNFTENSMESPSIVPMASPSQLGTKRPFQVRTIVI